MTLEKIARITAALNSNWDSNVKDIKLGMKALYDLIGLKRVLAEKNEQTQEAVQAIIFKHGGFYDEKNVLKVPEKEVEATNKEIEELCQQEVDIKINKIHLTENDFIPPVILEAIYDYVKF